MSQRQWRRWHLLRMALEGRISLIEPNDRMGISYRHAKRLKGSVARDMPRGTIHGNTGRHQANAIDGDLRQKIVGLSRTEYASFNDIRFTEKLSTTEGIGISRETVRKIRRQGGFSPRGVEDLRGIVLAVLVGPRKERWCCGTSLLTGGLGTAVPLCCLMAAMDDATSQCLIARLFSFENTDENTERYLWVLPKMVRD